MSRKTDRLRKLASEGDLEAIKEVTLLLKRDPENSLFKKAFYQGWEKIKENFGSFPKFLQDMKIPPKLQVEFYLEQLGFEPSALYRERAIARFPSDEVQEELGIKYIPRRTGRTTLILLNALCRIEGGLEAAVLIAPPGFLSKYKQMFFTYARALNINLSNCKVTFCLFSPEKYFGMNFSGRDPKTLFFDHFCFDGPPTLGPPLLLLR